MKRVLFFSVLMIAVLFASCKTVSDEAFDKVYNKYKSQLNLQGAKTHKVVVGDTLSELSQKFYDEAMYYPVIMLASSDEVKDPDKIYPGHTLIIPDIQINLADPETRKMIKNVINDCANLEARRDKDHLAKKMKDFANKL